MALDPLTRSGAALQVTGSNVRLSGANAYWLGLDDNAGTSSGSFPSNTTITNALQGMQAMNVKLVRAHTIGISTGTPLSYETAVGTYSDTNLRAADWAVAEAGRLGIRLMVPLTDNWNYYHGGKWNFVHWAYQQNSSGITDTPGTTKDDPNERIFFANTAPGLRVRALFKDYISHWLNHVNYYTGVAYKDDPTISIIETGNELYYAAQLGTNEWTQDIASYIKSIAPNKLVADGSAADRVAVSTMPGLTAAAVDIVGAHYYPQQQSGAYPPVEFNDSSAGYAAGTALQQLAADVTAAANAGKAFIVGEYPWTRSTVSSWWSAIEGNSAIDGDMYWSFIGGTETHGGSFGSDDYPVHYPYANSTESAYGPALASHTSAASTQAATKVWRIANISVSSSNTPPAGGIWKIAKISVSSGSATWRISSIGVSVNTAPAALWRIAKISVYRAAIWSIAKISVASSAAATPALSAPTSILVDPVMPATLTVLETSGIVPDSWSFTSPGITFTNVGGVATFSPPGNRTGATLTVTVTATKGANTSAPVFVTVNVNPTNDFYRSADGTLRGMSYPQSVRS